MRSYLDLIPISAKVHRRQSRMTRICIVLAVFLVTVIFGMADMEMRSQKIQAIQTDGSWHAGFRNLDDTQAALIAARPDVEVAARYDVLNYGITDGYQIEKTETVICGFDKALSEMYPAASTSEGTFPENINSVVCTESIKNRLGIELGDIITVTRPDGVSIPLQVCGFTKTTSMLTKADAFGIYLTTEAFRTHFQVETPSKQDGMLYVKFVSFCNIQKAIKDICTQFCLEESQVAQNVKILTLLLQTRDPYMMQFYLVAAILAILVAIAGILMIAGSLNSNVAQRTEFFGMMRCLGATPKQVARFVRKEALGWCKSSIPTALFLGTLVIWFLCALLRYLSPKLFEGMPIFGISWIGIVSGLMIGLFTVLLAAHAPAKRAASVSPLTAISGNAGTIPEAKKAANTRWLHIETALGIHHARGNLKNFLLMSGSFAFSIILFLSFSSLQNFMDHALTPLKPWQPDISIISPDNTCSIFARLKEELEAHPAVKRVYGRSFAYHITAKLHEKETSINLISYEQHQFAWANDRLLQGSIEEAINGTAVLMVYYNDYPLQLGDMISIETEEGVQNIPISGILSDCPFDREADTVPIICSEELFHHLTGEDAYTIIDIQLTRKASDEDVQKIRAMAGDENNFSDQRMSNAEVMGAYYAFVLFLYGFLAVILLITIVHIVNSIAMSVSARMRQYGALRAIGMSNRQMLHMVAAEAGTYAFFGILTGVICGLWFHRLFYIHLITRRWGDAWSIPVTSLLIVILVVLLSIALSIFGPIKRLQNMSIAETISAD